jgi:hypothetical protein
MSEIRSTVRNILSAVAVRRVFRLPEVDGQNLSPIAPAQTAFDSGAAERLLGYLYCLSLWVSSPLALWLNSGGLRLLIQWRAFSGFAYLSKRDGGWHVYSLRSWPVMGSLKAIHSGGETSCAMASSEAH